MAKVPLSWFTPDRRQQVQIFLGSLAPLLILGGFVTENVAEQWLIIIGAVFQFISNLSNLLHLEKGDASTAWEIIRGSVYGLGAVVAPALVTVGVFTFDSDLALTILSLVLAAVGNLVAIFTIDSQRKSTP